MVATRGGGAYHDGQPIKVSTRDRLEQVVVNDTWATVLQIDGDSYRMRGHRAKLKQLRAGLGTDSKPDG